MMRRAVLMLFAVVTLTAAACSGDSAEKQQDFTRVEAYAARGALDAALTLNPQAAGAAEAQALIASGR